MRKVVIYGANGQLGPHVVKALEGEYELHLNDVKDEMDTEHDYKRVDVSNMDEVIAAAEGMEGSCSRAPDTASCPFP